MRELRLNDIPNIKTLSVGVRHCQTPTIGDVIFKQRPNRPSSCQMFRLRFAVLNMIGCVIPTNGRNLGWITFYWEHSNPNQSQRCVYCPT
jgi:hypothetical protein